MKKKNYSLLHFEQIYVQLIIPNKDNGIETSFQHLAQIFIAKNTNALDNNQSKSYFNNYYWKEKVPAIKC